jgi:hypothetical protein
MASLALGAAGAFIGSFFGPIGASIGWSIGSALGSALDPQKIEGPRLSDLRLQTSSYGKSIPIVYGTKRISGNVIWQTDLTEHSQTTGGKGGPETTTYTYTASFAVLLCEGEISNITRVWADGRVVLDRRPGAAASVFPFTTYYGTETQGVDPTMEGVLGVGNVPAHRGLAYVVFDEIDLADFGQRIPNLEFEVVTLAHTNTAMSQTQHDEDHAVIFYRSVGGGDYPVILQWPTTDASKIRVVANGTTTVHEYNQDLTYSGAVTRSIDDAYPIIYTAPRPGGGTIRYQPIGTWLNGGVPTDVYILLDTLPIGNGLAEPIAGFSNPGIPSGEYPAGGCLTADRTGLFIFTAPTDGLDADKWYLLDAGAVVDSGTISPTLLARSGVANGNSAGNLYTSTGSYYGSMMAENNRRWLWRHYGAGALDGGVTSAFYISDSGVMAISATVGSCNVDGDPDDDYAGGSIYVIQDGYAGVVAGQTLAVFSRYPQGESLKVPVADIVTDISERAGLTAGEIDVTDIASSLVGYGLAQQMSARAAIEPLQAAYFFDPVESDAKVKFVERNDTTLATIDDDDLAAYVGDSPPPILSTQRQQEVELPRVVDIVYINSGADYQEGNQRALRNGTLSQTATAISVPIAMTDTEAKSIADRSLYIAWSEREKFKFTTTRKFSKYEPTDVLEVHGRNVRVTEKVEQPSGLIEWSGVAAVAGATFIQGAVPGTGSGFVEQVPPSIQGTTLRLLDIPLLSDNDSPIGFYVAMAGAIDTNWRGATLYRSIDGGVNYVAQQTATTASRIGTCTTTLGNFLSGNIFDELNTVTVELSPGSADLTSSNELGVLNGANVCLIGSELLQYKTATLTSLRTYVLSGLLRGRRGTEWAISTHGASEQFVAFPQSLTIAGEQSEINLSRYYKAVTSSQPLSGAVATAFANTGVAARTYSPCQLGGGRDASGNLTLNWVRRDKIGGGWVDYTDVPLSETGEFYCATIYSDSSYTTIKRQIYGPTATASYTAANQTTDFGSTQSTVYWDVYQAGAVGYKAARGAT